MSPNTTEFATSSVLSSSLEITNDAHHTEATPVAHNASPSTLNQTEGGNAIFTLGDADLDDEEFAAMLEAYNSDLNITINPLQAMLPPAAQNPPIIYSERVDEEQDDFNFENNAIDWNEFLVEADQFATELETAFAASSIPLDSMTEAQRTALYDSNNAFLRNAEANRSNNATWRGRILNDLFWHKSALCQFRRRVKPAGDTMFPAHFSMLHRMNSR